MVKAILNESGVATNSGDIIVYNYDGETREFLVSSVEFLAEGVGIPAYSCIDTPLKGKEGFAVCRKISLDGWEYVADHRGKMVYETKTGQAVKINALGDYAEGVTTIAPITPYDQWNGSEWVTDMNAQKESHVAAAQQKQNSLLAEAQNTISFWQTGLQLGIISDDDKASLITWMKYIQALNAVDTSTAPDIEWPVKPK